MNRLTFLIAALVALLFTACKKASVSNDSPYLKAKMNNSTWQAINIQSSRKASSDTVTVIAHAVPPGEETLIFSFKLTGKGTFEPIGGISMFFKTTGLDVITSNYASLNKAGSAVAITEYNEQAGTIRGTFKLSFQNTTPGANATDEVNFSDGSFYVKITTR